MLRSHHIYICQGDAGINTIWSSSSWDDKASDWPGENELDAVQKLQEKYPYYYGDLFLVRHPDNPDYMTPVRVDDNGKAVKEWIE